MCDPAQCRLWLEATSKLKGDVSERGEGQALAFRMQQSRIGGVFLACQKNFSNRYHRLP